MITSPRILTWMIALCLSSTLYAAEPIDHDAALEAYFDHQTSQIELETIARLESDVQYKDEQETYREQLASMLGLSPMPERTPLKPVVTGEIEEETFTVKNLQFQASPGLYVTANLYLPKNIEKPAPAILYVCGHSNNKKDGISYGNKVGYQHHGIWYAQNGYVCLMIDTIQLGEFQGIHHGTYSKGMWWWNARGYTPAGVEAWNGIRSIDYLQSLPEVDPERIGVTGRSGGGAYSWWIAALDKRIKAAVPVAGITSMRNHIVDDCIEGHCDCMFQVNSEAWDFPMISALVAPRALLITNTDKDSIFPLDGVMDVYWKTKMVYEHFGAAKNLGIAIAEGPHKDTQRLQVNEFEWFDRHLKKSDQQAEPAEKLYEPEQLRVFHELPADEITSTIHDSFVPMATPPELTTAKEWQEYARKTHEELSTNSFAHWPVTPNRPLLVPLESNESNSTRETIYRFDSQTHVPLKLTLPDFLPRNPAESVKITLYIVDEEPTEVDRESFLPDSSQEISIIFTPRGLGSNQWSGDEKKQNHIRRRFALIGQSLDSMRVWDIMAAIRAVRQKFHNQNVELIVDAAGNQAINALYANLMLDHPVDHLNLQDIPTSHMQGPTYLNVLKILDIPQALALAAQNTPIDLDGKNADVLDFYRQVQKIEGVSLKPIQTSGQDVTSIDEMNNESLCQIDNPSDEPDSPLNIEEPENLDMKTFGGSQFWSDIHFFRDYRIQQNVFTKHCRLLDNRNVRYEYGEFDACVAKLEEIRVEQELKPMSGEAVILLHGILRSASSFTPLKKSLEEAGYLVFAANYPSTKITIEQAAADLQKIIDSLEGVETIHLVGHSMGGLVIRAWFGLPGSESIAQQLIGKVVMLGTPNHGAELADFFDKFPPFHWLFGKAGSQLRTMDETIDKLPIPTVPFGVIAGARGSDSNGYNPMIPGDDDGTVTVASTNLEGMTDFYSFPCLHLYLMRDKRAITAIENFLKTNSFTLENENSTNT